MWDVGHRHYKRSMKRSQAWRSQCSQRGHAVLMQVLVCQLSRVVFPQAKNAPCGSSLTVFIRDCTLMVRRASFLLLPCVSLSSAGRLPAPSLVPCASAVAQFPVRAHASATCVCFAWQLQYLCSCAKGDRGHPETPPIMGIKCG